MFWVGFNLGGVEGWIYLVLVLNTKRNDTGLLGTIEAIGKYQLISGPPIKIHIMHSMRHDNSPIF